MTAPVAVDSLAAARALLARHPIIDGHNDLPFELRELVNYDLDAYDIGQRQSRTHTDLVRLAEGGVGAQFWSVFVPAGRASGRSPPPSSRSTWCARWRPAIRTG